MNMHKNLYISRHEIKEKIKNLAHACLGATVRWYGSYCCCCWCGCCCCCLAAAPTTTTTIENIVVDSYTRLVSPLTHTHTHAHIFAAATVADNRAGYSRHSLIETEGKRERARESRARENESTKTYVVLCCCCCLFPLAHAGMSII